MAPQQLLEPLLARGLTIVSDKPGVLTVSPASLIDDAVRDYIRAHRVQLLELFSATTSVPMASPSPVEIKPAARECLPDLTPAELKEVIGWDDHEIARGERYVQMAKRHGLDADTADRVSDLLTLRDRRHDSRHSCLECTHLDAAGRCHAARAGFLPGARQDFAPAKLTLHCCPAFQSDPRT